MLKISHLEVTYPMKTPSTLSEFLSPMMWGLFQQIIERSVSQLIVLIIVPSLYTQSLVSHADTTDVQVVKVTLIEGANASTIQCEFIAGSDATGCMVVLIGFVAYHVNLTMNINTCRNSAITTITLEHPPSSYTGVEAFDIESDGSVGSLAVPGQLGGRLETPCIIAVETVPGN